MKRLRRIVRWIAIVAAAAISILLVLNAYFVWSTGTQLERRLAALREAGDPMQIGDFAREPIPPEKNADVFLRRTADDLGAIQKELLAQYPQVGFPSGNMSSVDQDKLEKLFAAYPNVMPLLEKAASCPDSDPQLDCSLPTSRFLEPYVEHTNKHRLLYRVLRPWSELLLAKGRADDALATQILMLRLTRQWRREPLIIGYLVTMASKQVAMAQVNRVLQSCPVSPGARRSLDAELALHDTIESQEWVLLSERAYTLSSIREMPGSGFWLTRGFANELALGFIDFYDQCLAKGSRAYADVVSDEKTAAAPRYGPNLYGGLIKAMEVALGSVREARERTRAISRSLRVLNALQSRVPPGADPIPKLAELGLPEAATIDPYNGQPLHIKKLPEGWTVYSVGSNLVDDGGRLAQIIDIGVGPMAVQKTQKD